MKMVHYSHCNIIFTIQTSFQFVFRIINQLKLFFSWQANPKNASAPAAGTMATEDPEVIIHYLMIPKIVSLSYYFQISH